MATRRALGRGLSALLSDNRVPVEKAAFGISEQMPGDQLLEIDIDLIDPNPDQPRTRFNETKLEELAHSIKESGLVQPILVRRIESGRYQIVAGERRWRASQKAGLHRITAVVREVSDEGLLELALVENIQRQELNPIEEAQAYQRLMNGLGATQDEIARRVGKDRSSIANSLRLLRLSGNVQSLLEGEKLSAGHARALLALEEEHLQEKLAAEIIQRRLSVREVEKAVKRIISGAAASSNSTTVVNDANIRAAELKLKKKLGTQVKIHAGRQGGKIEIGFNSMGELDRIYSIIMQKADPIIALPEAE